MPIITSMRNDDRHFFISLLSYNCYDIGQTVDISSETYFISIHKLIYNTGAVLLRPKSFVMRISSRGSRPPVVR